MPLYSVPHILASILVVITGFFVLYKNPRSTTNKIFLLNCLLIGVWFSFFYVGYKDNFANYNYFYKIWYRVIYSAVTMFPLVASIFTKSFLNSRITFRAILFEYVFTLISILLIFTTDFIISGLHTYNWGVYAKVGKFHPIYLVCFIGIFITSVIEFLKHLSNENDPTKRNQIKYVLLAFAVGYIACIDFIPNYGIEMFPLGYIPVTCFILMMCYAIVRHKAFNIEIVIKKGLVYSGILTIITIIFSITTLVLEKSFQSYFGYQTIITSIVAAFIISIIFLPVRNILQNYVDKKFFHGTPEEISQQNALLRREVAQAEKLKAVATLASGMAHEIKNPLTAIQTFTEYLPERQNDPEFLNKFSTIVGKEVNRINDLVHQLLDFAKPAPLSFTAIDIHSILNDITTFLSNEFVKKNIGLLREYTTEDTHIHGDPNKLKQAFLNILLNALQACPEGGQIILRTHNSDKSIEISIQDTGHGIDAKDLPYIFDPFFTRKENGSGLGLSITQGIIREHSGKITVNSQMSRGSTFLINLPFKTAQVLKQ